MGLRVWPQGRVSGKIRRRGRIARTAARAAEVKSPSTGRSRRRSRCARARASRASGSCSRPRQSEARGCRHCLCSKRGARRSQGPYIDAVLARGPKTRPRPAAAHDLCPNKQVGPRPPRSSREHRTRRASQAHAGARFSASRVPVAIMAGPGRTHICTCSPWRRSRAPAVRPALI